MAEEMMVTEGDAFALQDRIATKRARQAQSGLHSAMLQIYGLTGGEDALAASVLTAYPWPDDTNPMLFALQQALNTTRTEWANFQTEVAAELPKKQNMYLALGDRARRRTTQRGPV